MPGNRIYGRLRYWAFAAVTAGISLAVLLLAVEIGFRLRGTEPSLQPLFTDDPVIGYRPRPRAEMTFTTTEFSTKIRINSAGFRDDEIGAKPAGEHRVVVLGDSMVMAIQVPLEMTFVKRLEAGLRRATSATRYRVINAGVQGYGTVEEWLLFERTVDLLQPDVVVVAVMVGNDAVESADSSWRMEPRKPRSHLQSTGSTASLLARRLARRSEVIQFLRQRLFTAASPTRAVPLRQRPLDSYVDPVPAEVREGFQISARCVERIADLARSRGAPTAVALLPARFQLDDQDFANLQHTMSAPNRAFVRDAATDRYRAALAVGSVPVLDLLPVFQREPRPAELYFRQNVHLTTRGHQVVAGALARFLHDERIVPAPVERGEQ